MIVDVYTFPGLASGWSYKLTIAAVLGILLEVVAFVVDLYGRLFEVDPLLIALVVLLIAADWITGMIRAARNKVPITSRAMRRSGRKAIEYVVLIGAAVGLANGFSTTSVAPATGWIDEGVLLYVALTEFLSVLENVTGSREGALGILRTIRALGRGDVDAVLGSEKPAETPTGGGAP